jgi:hypothetical protein
VTLMETNSVREMDDDTRYPLDVCLDNIRSNEDYSRDKKSSLYNTSRNHRTG